MLVADMIFLHHSGSKNDLHKNSDPIVGPKHGLQSLEHLTYFRRKFYFVNFLKNTIKVSPSEWTVLPFATLRNSSVLETRRSEVGSYSEFSSIDLRFDISTPYGLRILIVSWQFLGSEMAGKGGNDKCFRSISSLCPYSLLLRSKRQWYRSSTTHGNGKLVKGAFQVLHWMVAWIELSAFLAFSEGLVFLDDLSDWPLFLFTQAFLSLFIGLGFLLILFGDRNQSLLMFIFLICKNALTSAILGHVTIEFIYIRTSQHYCKMSMEVIQPYFAGRLDTPDNVSDCRKDCEPNEDSDKDLNGCPRLMGFLMSIAPFDRNLWLRFCPMCFFISRHEHCRFVLFNDIACQVNFCGKSPLFRTYQLFTLCQMDACRPWSNVLFSRS